MGSEDELTLPPPKVTVNASFATATLSAFASESDSRPRSPNAALRTPLLRTRPGAETVATAVTSAIIGRERAAGHTCETVTGRGGGCARAWKGQVVNL
eukprot:6593747-Prymnesium_polylepis.1